MKLKTAATIIVVLLLVFLFRRKIYGTEVKYSEYYKGWYVRENILFFPSYIHYDSQTRDIEYYKPPLENSCIYQTKEEAIEVQKAWERH